MKDKFFLYLLFLLLLSSCSSYRKDLINKETLLVEEIEKWNQFRIDGIIELNYKEFVFRKQFIAQKNYDAFRIDVIDGGLLAFNPTPFFSLYADTLVYSKKFPDYKLDITSLPDSFNDLDLKKIIGNTYQLARTKQMEKNGFMLIFDSDMKINYLKSEDLQIEFIYHYLRNIEKIQVKKQNKLIATLHIDKMIKGNHIIAPLQ
jgi:hypothetical protein